MSTSRDPGTKTTRKKSTLLSLSQMRENHEKIVMITSYDASFNGRGDARGGDIVLAGDSLATCIQGHA